MSDTCRYCHVFSRHPCDEYRARPNSLRQAFAGCFNLDRKSQLIILADDEDDEMAQEMLDLIEENDRLKHKGQP